MTTYPIHNWKIERKSRPDSMCANLYDPQNYYYVLTGYAYRFTDKIESIITSPIICIDFINSYVTTESGTMYKLMPKFMEVDHD